MKQRTKALLVLIFGILFILAGVVSLVLPLLPGWLFFGIGLILLSLYSPRLRAWVERHTRRWPKLHAFVAKVQGWADRTIGNV